MMVAEWLKCEKAREGAAPSADTAKDVFHKNVKMTAAKIHLSNGLSECQSGLE